MNLEKENYRAYTFIEMSRGINATQIHRQLEESSCLNVPPKRTIQHWCQSFREENKENLSDAPRSGRPSTETTEDNVEILKNLIEDQPKQSLRQLSKETGLSKDTVHRILTDHLGKRKVCSVWVPHKLSERNKEDRVLCATELINFIESNSIDFLLKHWVTEDETWQLFDSLATKEQNKCWLSKDQARPTVVKPKLTQRKVLLIVAFTGDRKFNVEVCVPGEIVDSDRYIEFVRNTGEKWRRLHSSPTKLSELIWQHDNARAHSSTQTTDFFQRRSVTLLRQSAYSPDLNQCDGWLFKILKNELKKVDFSDANEVLNHTLQVLRSIPKERFINEINKLVQHCKNVIKLNGDYVTK